MKSQGEIKPGRKARQVSVPHNPAPENPAPENPAPQINEARYWQAVVARDSACDGQFFYGVLTTGVYCKPSCAARLPLRKNVRFYTSAVAAEGDGLRPCKRCHAGRRSEFPAMSALMHDICRYIERHGNEKLPLELLAHQAGMSSSHFQRLFKKEIGISPRKYQEAWRIGQLKADLRQGGKVSDAMLDSGFESSSRLYEKLDRHMGMTPGSYRQGGQGQVISYASAATQLGKVMIGATDRGICFLQFGEDDTSLYTQLCKEYPQARIERMRQRAVPLFNRWIGQLNDYLEAKVARLKLPLDIQGTTFQRLVWDYLMNTPQGSLLSYSEVAQGIGKPNAARAVARACAGNRIAIAIPCHRVIRGDGGLAGYKWGAARKRVLIDLERRAPRSPTKFGETT